MRLTPAELLYVQTQLAGVWTSESPEEVYTRLLDMPRETVLQLLMVNIGSTALTVSRGRN